MVNLLRKRWIQLSVIVACAAAGFLVGGGTTFFGDDGIDQLLYHSPSEREKILEIGRLFVFHGGAGAVAGSLVAVAALAIFNAKQRET